MHLPPPDLSVFWTGPPQVDDTRGPYQLAVLDDLGLTDASRVLEIGCGVGRLAYLLAPRLRSGSYAGFDVSDEAIGWLHEHYAPVLANFRFDLVDARNPRFRPDQGSAADEITFPYATSAFDLAACFAVFMHLTLPEVRRYLRELGRVLEPGGRAAIEMMTIDDLDESPTFGTPYVEIDDGVYTRRPDRDGVAMAYHDDLFRGAVHDAGLTIDERFVGGWHHRRDLPSARFAPGADLYLLTAS